MIPMIGRLYEMLKQIPTTGAINLARRRIIIQKIAELEKEASKE